MPSTLEDGIDEQPDVEHRNDTCQRIEEAGVPRFVGILAHYALRRCEAHLQEHRKRQLYAKYHLRDDKPLEGITDEEDNQKRQSERETDAHYRVRVFGIVRLTEHSGKDTSCRHAARNGARHARK